MSASRSHVRREIVSRNLLLVALGIVLGAACPLEAAERYAFLVGVRQYDKRELTSLRYTERDVEALAGALKNAGYRDENIVVMTQTRGANEFRYLPISKNIEKEFLLLLRELQNDDSVLVAFSGHGVQLAGEKDHYFCPSDARLDSRATLISLENVYKALEKCPAQTKVLLVDACRDNPQTQVSKAAKNVRLEPVTGVKPPTPSGGIAALFSCSPGEQSYESPTLEHGVFFHFVVQGLKGEADSDRDQEVTLIEIEQYTLKNVQRYVRTELGGEQTPARRGESRGLAKLARVDNTRLVRSKGRELFAKGDYLDAAVEFSAAIETSPDAAGYVGRGQAYVGLGKYDEALADFAEALRLDSRSAEAYTHRAQAWLDVGKLSEAVADCNAALALDGKNRLAHLHRAWAYYWKGDWSLADADCTAAAQGELLGRALALRGVIRFERGKASLGLADMNASLQAPALTAEDFVDRADIHWTRNDSRAAIEMYNQALRLNPAHERARAYRGMIRASRCELTEGLGEVRQAVRNSPRLIRAQFMLALVQQMRHEFDEAFRTLNRAIEAAPEFADSYKARGDLHAWREDLDSAAEDYEKARRLSPEALYIRITQANLLWTRGREDLAENEFDAMLLVSPDYYGALSARAAFRRDHGRYEEALRDLDRLAKIMPQSDDLPYERALVHYAASEYEKALAEVNKVLEVTPNEAEALMLRGHIQADQGDEAAAFASYDRVVRLVPRHAEALVNRGNRHYAKGESDEAYADFDEAIRVRPTFALAWASRGAARQQDEDYESAESDYDDALRLAPQNSGYHSDRGWVRYYRERYDEALADFEQAITLSDVNSSAFNGRAWVRKSKGDYRQAIADFDTAIRLNAEYADAYLGRGKARIGLAQYNEALADFRLAIAKDNENLGDAQDTLRDEATRIEGSDAYNDEYKKAMRKWVDEVVPLLEAK